MLGCRGHAGAALLPVSVSTKWMLAICRFFSFPSSPFLSHCFVAHTTTTTMPLSPADRRRLASREAVPSCLSGLACNKYSKTHVQHGAYRHCCPVGCADATGSALAGWLPFSQWPECAREPKNGSGRKSNLDSPGFLSTRQFLI